MLIVLHREKHRKMKAITLVLSAFIILTMSCNSLKLGKKAPFSVKKAYVVENNDSLRGKGKLLNLELKNTLQQAVTLDSVYYSNTRGKLLLVADSDTNFQAFFPYPFIKNDLILHSDPRKEFGNKPPAIREKSPFELTENECVVSYLKNGKKGYYKVKLSEK